MCLSGSDQEKLPWFILTEPKLYVGYLGRDFLFLWVVLNIIKIVFNVSGMF